MKAEGRSQKPGGRSQEAERETFGECSNFCVNSHQPLTRSLKILWDRHPACPAWAGEALTQKSHEHSYNLDILLSNSPELSQAQILFFLYLDPVKIKIALKRLSSSGSIVKAVWDTTNPIYSTQRRKPSDKPRLA